MDKFTSKHFVFIMCATGIVSMKTYPWVFMRDGGRESWIGAIIGAIIAFIFYVYIFSICRKYKSYSLHKIYTKALGEKLGNIVLILFVLTLFLSLIESAAAEANSMHTNMLLETPQWYLLLFFIIPLIYPIRKDIVAVVTVSMIGIIFMMLAGINLAILTTKYKDFSLLFPVFSHGVHKGFFTSLIKILGLYGTISISLPYLVKIRDNKKLVFHGIVGLIIIFQMEIVATIGIISSFGIDFSRTMPYPKLLQTQQISYGKFLEFGELYVMLQILGGWMLKYLLSFYAILLLFKEMFGFKKKQLLYTTYGMSVLVYFASWYFANQLRRLFMFFEVYTYICFINFIVIPLIVFILFAVKMNKEKVEANV